MSPHCEAGKAYVTLPCTLRPKWSLRSTRGDNDLAPRADPPALRLPLPLFVMTRFAQQFKVVPVQCDVGIPDVLRRQRDLVVYFQRSVLASCFDNPTLQAALT